MSKAKPDRHILFSILSTLLLHLLLTAAPVTTAGAAELAIIYSNDIIGEIEPCG